MDTSLAGASLPVIYRNELWFRVLLTGTLFTPVQSRILELFKDITFEVYPPCAIRGLVTLCDKKVLTEPQIFMKEKNSGFYIEKKIPETFIEIEIWQDSKKQCSLFADPVTLGAASSYFHLQNSSNFLLKIDGNACPPHFQSAKIIKDVIKFCLGVKIQVSEENIEALYFFAKEWGIPKLLHEIALKKPELVVDDYVETYFAKHPVLPEEPYVFKASVSDFVLKGYPLFLEKCMVRLSKTVVNEIDLDVTSESLGKTIVFLTLNNPKFHSIALNFIGDQEEEVQVFLNSINSFFSVLCEYQHLPEKCRLGVNLCASLLKKCWAFSKIPLEALTHTGPISDGTPNSIVRGRNFHFNLQFLNTLESLKELNFYNVALYSYHVELINQIKSLKKLTAPGNEKVVSINKRQDITFEV